MTYNMFRCTIWGLAFYAGVPLYDMHIYMYTQLAMVQYHILTSVVRGDTRICRDFS